MVSKTIFKTVIEDSSRNKFMFFYNGTSLCCREVSKDGVSKDTIIAAQVSEKFLTAIDLQDNIYVICTNEDKGILLFCYAENQWTLQQILSIQGSGSVYLLSLFVFHGAIHILYAKQMAIANFFNVYHLHRVNSPMAAATNTPWRKNSVCEIYAEDLDKSYSSVFTKDGAIHIVSEWYDGKSYLINSSRYDVSTDIWKRKPITSLFKKDITVSILYEENILHLLCYTFDDDVSAFFYYTKKENSGRDFEFVCLDKIRTPEAVEPQFYIEGGTLYSTWVGEGKYSQYALNREQKNWSKKMESTIPSGETVLLIESIRNRKGKALIIKKTYFSIDAKNNINMPYFKESSYSSQEMTENRAPRGGDADLARQVPALLEEIKSLSEMVKELKQRLEKLENSRPHETERVSAAPVYHESAAPKPRPKEGVRLRSSSFKEQFMNSNKLLHRPEAIALYVGAASIPNPEEISKKEGIEFVENNITQNELAAEPILSETVSPTIEPHKELQTIEVKQQREPVSTNQPQLDADQNTSKESNLFKKIGDFFK